MSMIRETALHVQVSDHDGHTAYYSFDQAFKLADGSRVLAHQLRPGDVAEPVAEKQIQRVVKMDPSLGDRLSTYLHPFRLKPAPAKGRQRYQVPRAFPADIVHALRTCGITPTTDCGTTYFFCMGQPLRIVVAEGETYLEVLQ